MIKSHSAKLYQKKYHSFVAVGIVTTHNDTDGNKLVIFSSIALYYGDTYIIQVRAELMWSHVYYSSR